MKFFLTTLIFFNCSFYVCFSQENTHFCATDELHYQLYHENPGLQKGIENAAQKLEMDTEYFLQNPYAPKSNDPYIIPVVFHVIHNHGSENISNEQIYDAVEQANIQLRKKNSDTTDIVPDFEAIAADTEIEIRLARKDPDGNCTNGITRNVSELTYIGDHEVKSIIQWPPDKYLNIYVCAEAAGLAGHAMLPAAADTIPEWDGIVMQDSYVGTVGTSNYFRRTVLTHEIGHYLNLQHIWGGNNVPGYFYLPVAESNNCNHDDGVADTPNTIGWQSCDLNGASCGDLDNVQNYMDYAYCARMFTEGQKQRMQACLNSSVANRNNLWSQNNLEETGVDGSYSPLCKVQFNSDVNLVCVNEPISLIDLSYHGVESRNWSLPGANITSSVDSFLTISYPSPGSYDVILEVVNGNDTLKKLRTDFIHVVDEVGAYEGLSEDFEWEPSFNNRFIIEDSKSNYNWELTNVGYESSHSIYFNNFENQSKVSRNFISKPIDISSLNDFKITFDVSYAMRNNQTNDNLFVELSTDCGETWLIRGSFSSFNMRFDDEYYESPFIPENSEQWVQKEITTFTSNNFSDNLMVRFRFESDGGNNIFIDNILMGHPDVLDNQKMNHLSEVEIFPNPFSDKINIKVDKELKAELTRVSLIDNAGKVHFEQMNNFENEQEIDLGFLSSGIYILQLTTSSNTSRYKLVKQ